MSRASAIPTPASPASQASAPLAVHGLDWQQALLDLPASATPAQRDAVVADWAQRCWQDLCLALPQQRHVVLAHPGQLQERARICMVASEASGWLHSPLHHAPDAPRRQADSADLLLQQARRAAAEGFCGAEVGLLAAAAVFAALDDAHAQPGAAAASHASQALAWQRRHFPLLGAPRARAFAPMPAAMLQAGHAWGLYAVMGDADWTIRCMELGVKLVQLRIKQAAADEIDAQIIRCAQAAHALGALLIINDHWQAALRLAQRI